MSTAFQTKIPNSLNEHWMPFSSNKDFKKNPRIIVKAEGIHLHTHDGKTLIDGSSGSVSYTHLTLPTTGSV